MDVDPRETNLPKWAQTTLTRLRREVEDAQRGERDARLASGPEDSDTLLDAYNKVPIRLGRGTTVRFMPDGPDARNNWIDVRIRRAGQVDVMASSTLAVSPQATNMVTAWVVDR